MASLVENTGQTMSPRLKTSKGEYREVQLIGTATHKRKLHGNSCKCSKISMWRLSIKNFMGTQSHGDSTILGDILQKLKQVSTVNMRQEPPVASVGRGEMKQF